MSSRVHLPEKHLVSISRLLWIECYLLGDLFEGLKKKKSFISGLSSFVYFIIASSDKIYVILHYSRELLIKWHEVRFLTTITSYSGVALLLFKIRTRRKNAELIN